MTTLYFIHGKYVISAMIDKIERVGKRHYMPYSYTYYKGRHYKGGDKKTAHSVLSWIAVALIILGLLAMFEVFD